MELKRLFFSMLVLSGGGLMCAAPGAVRAQSASAPPDAESGGLDELVVTAQRREELPVDVPITITALSQSQLATSNVQNLADIAQLTPALRFDNQSAWMQPSIRGIGTGITTSGGGSNVGIYIDGFYSPNPTASDFQLTDVTSIAVLKGPQGTLFGHNTTGGAILVTTAEPSIDPHVDAKVSYGSFNAQRYQAYATTGITSNIAVDVEGIYSKGNGFVTNIVDDDNHVGQYENWTVRAGLKVTFADGVYALARFTHASMNDPTPQLTNSNTDSTVDPTTGKAWGVQTQTVPGLYTTNPNQVAENQPVFFTTSNNIAQLTFKADLGFANFTSYSQYRQEDVNQLEDLDQTALNIFELGVPVYDKTWTQEFILSSNPGPKLQWTAGAFYFSDLDQWTTDIDNAYATAGPVRLGGSGTVTQNYAAYLDATYELTPQWFFTLGARYSHDIVDGAYYNPYLSAAKVFVPSIDNNKATPRAVIRFKPTDDSTLYASYTEGYKSRIIDVGGSCQDPPAYKCNPVEPETVNAYEVGYKMENHRFSNDVAAYYYDYKNLQVSEYLGAAEAFIVNAPRSRIYGLEDSFHFNVNEHYQLFSGVSWTRARYVSFATTVDGAVVGTPIYASCPASGGLPAKYAGSCGAGSFDYVNTDSVLHNTPMQHTPAWNVNAGGRATTGMTGAGEFALSSNFYYTSSFYFSPSGTQFLQPGYETLGARAEWTHPSKHLTVALYGENLTNERYRTQVQYNGFGIGATWSAPVTWGVEVGTKF
jgi:iron complex outermembrane receptor protein